MRVYLAVADNALSVTYILTIVRPKCHVFSTQQRGAREVRRTSTMNFEHSCNRSGCHPNATEFSHVCNVLEKRASEKRRIATAGLRTTMIIMPGDPRLNSQSHVSEFVQ
jgi:hypothetical protein